MSKTPISSNSKEKIHDMNNAKKMNKAETSLRNKKAKILSPYFNVSYLIDDHW